MAELLRRWTPTCVLGIGIWVLSLPLLLGSAPTVLPAAAGSSSIAQPAAPRSAAPAVPAAANWISIPRLGIDQPVGWYSDCLGTGPVPRRGGVALELRRLQ